MEEREEGMENVLIFQRGAHRMRYSITIFPFFIEPRVMFQTLLKSNWAGTDKLLKELASRFSHEKQFSNFAGISLTLRLISENCLFKLKIPRENFSCSSRILNFYP